MTRHGHIIHRRQSWLCVILLWAAGAALALPSQATGKRHDCANLNNEAGGTSQRDGIPDGGQLWTGKERDLLQWDDGSSENSLGLTAGGELCWLHHFTVAQPGTLQNIQTCFGTPLYPGGSGVSAAQPFRVYVWSDPNADGNPSDAVFLGEATGTVSAASIDTDVLQSVALSIPISGSFFVGASVVTPAYTYPAPMDTDGPQYNQAWVTFNVVPFDPNNITPNLYNVTEMGYPGNWLLRAEVTFAGPLCGDFNHDGVVGIEDYWFVVDTFGSCWGDPKFFPEADFDLDGCISLMDYQLFLNLVPRTSPSAWGSTP